MSTGKQRIAECVGTNNLAAVYHVLNRHRHCYTDTDDVEQAMDIDKDGDGLIEICDLEGLNEIRFQLDGSGYTTGTSAMGAMKITTGCPNDRCIGYELTSGLDFMDDNSYRTIANKVTWTMGDGWQPIGTFNATFNGNGYTISNLMINRSDTNNVGLFSRTASSARITNLGLLNVAITGQNEVGSLVGWNDGGSIANSYATGSVADAGGNVGGLVGLNNGGSITNSYATVSVLRSGSMLGGLVGTNRARITNSYATGRVSGTQVIGSLVGFNTGGNALIEDSYATGRVSWSRFTAIGGLVGQNVGTINDSYWLREDATNRTGINVSRSTLRTTMELQEPTTTTGIYADWSTADWDFGSSIQYPILKAAGSDTLLPNQGVGLRSLQTAIVGAELIPTFGGATTRHTFIVPFGTSRIDLTLTAYNPVATIALVKQGESPVTDYFAGKGSRGTASVPIATTPVLSITVSEPNLDPIVYRVVVTTLPLCTVSLNIPDDNDGVEQVLDIDKDNDGLIEICDVEGLDAMRHVLDGSGYKTTDSAMVAAITEGCPSGDCNGYELARSLDFMDDNSYRTTANKVTYTVSNYNDSN